MKRLSFKQVLWKAVRSALALRTHREGATAVEFGIIAAPLFAIICAVFEIAYVNVENEMLASAVTKAARAMLTGKMQAAQISTGAQFVNTYLCPATGPRLVPSNFNCSQLIVDVRPATTFTGADITSDFYKSGNNQFCPGAPGQIVVVRVAYPLGAIFPANLFNRSMGVVTDVPGEPGSYHILMGSALFQEEAYTTGYTPPPGC